MSHRIACLSAAAASLLLAGLPRPAAAADYYDEGRGPAVFHGRDAVDGDDDGTAPRHPRGGPGPVVFDERDAGRRFAPGFPRRDPDFGPDLRHGEGRGFGPGGPVLVERLAFRDGPRFAGPLPAYGPRVAGPLPAYGPRFAGPLPAYGPRFAGPLPAYGVVVERPLPRYRAVAAPVGAEVYDEGYGAPDIGCTVEEAESTTPAGWRKTVTHRTCYRR